MNIVMLNLKQHTNDQWYVKLYKLSNKTIVHTFPCSYCKVIFGRGCCRCNLHWVGHWEKLFAISKWPWLYIKQPESLRWEGLSYFLSVWIVHMKRVVEWISQIILVMNESLKNFFKWFGWHSKCLINIVFHNMDLA